MPSEIRNDTRGVSEAVSYIFILGISVVFVFGGFASFALVGNATEYHKANQMDAEGHQLKGAIEEVDRRVRASESTGPIGVHITLSTHIGNSKYDIKVVQYPSGDSYITLQTHSGDLKTRIENNPDIKVEPISKYE
jgi:hypothetical protein